MTNKEYGSDFHYFYEAKALESSLFENDFFSFFFSGRVALYNLLQYGIKEYQWEKVGFPSYYCHEVVEFCRNLPIEVVYYNFNPVLESTFYWEDHPKNVLINVDFFGIKKADVSSLQKTIIIEDLTHNLLSIVDSKADYCFGSLRKQLPLAVGGFCYSKNALSIPEIGINNFANEIAMAKLSAMFLKAAYLKGNFAQKDVFRQLYVEAETQFESLKTNSRLPEVVQSQLYSLPCFELIKKTYANVQQMKSSVRPCDHIKVLHSEKKTEMGLVLVFDTTDLRDQLKAYLIENNIYPAILWPHQLTDNAVNLQEKIIFIHSDFRYDESDIEFITSTLNKFISNV